MHHSSFCIKFLVSILDIPLEYADYKKPGIQDKTKAILKNNFVGGNGLKISVIRKVGINFFLKNIIFLSALIVWKNKEIKLIAQATDLPIHPLIALSE